MVFASKELINKGWSGDLKYKVTTADGRPIFTESRPPSNTSARKMNLNICKGSQGSLSPCVSPSSLV